MPTRIGRVLNVLRKLIDYGKHLAGTVQQRATAPGFTFFAKPFGTADIALIIARITNGLRRAAALEAELLQRAARGQDLTTTPFRRPAIRTPGPARQVAPPATQPEPRPAAPMLDPRLARLPTEAEIAAEVRRRPVGAVIVDICRDLGITPGQFDHEFWHELTNAIIAYGGNLASFLTHLNKLLLTFRAGDRADCADHATTAPPQRQPALATGPP
jgi:hypothetical protein